MLPSTNEHAFKICDQYCTTRYQLAKHQTGCSSVVVSTPAYHALVLGLIPARTRPVILHVKTWLSTLETVCISVSFGGDTKSHRSVAANEISIWRLATKYLDQTTTEMRLWISLHDKRLLIHHSMLERTEMIMLRWIMRMKRIEKTGNEEIRARAGLANMSKKIRKVRLRLLCTWIERLKKMCSNENMKMGGHRKIGRRKLRWSDVIK